MNLAGVFDRETIAKIIPKPGNVVILITCPENDFPILEDGWDDILRLRFDDINQKSDTSFSEYEAKKILNFVIKNFDKYIFISCDAGLSRSAGVFVALDWLFNHRELVDLSAKYPLHNTYVRDKIIETWYKGIWHDN